MRSKDAPGCKKPPPALPSTTLPEEPPAFKGPPREVLAAKEKEKAQGGKNEQAFKGPPREVLAAREKEKAAMAAPGPGSARRPPNAGPPVAKDSPPPPGEGDALKSLLLFF